MLIITALDVLRSMPIAVTRRSVALFHNIFPLLGENGFIYILNVSSVKHPYVFTYCALFFLPPLLSCNSLSITTALRNKTVDWVCC